MRGASRGAEVARRESEPMTARVERIEVCILRRRLMAWGCLNCGILRGQRMGWRTNSACIQGSFIVEPRDWFWGSTKLVSEAAAVTLGEYGCRDRLPSY